MSKRQAILKGCYELWHKEFNRQAIRDDCASLQKVHEYADPKIATPQHIAKLAAKKEPGRIVDNRLNRPLRRRLLCLAALITRRQHTRMPLLSLGVGITEPFLTHRAAYGRRIGAGRIARRDALAQPLQVRAFIFLFFHPHDIPRVAILLPLVCLPGNLDDETEALLWETAPL